MTLVMKKDGTLDTGHMSVFGAEAAVSQARPVKQLWLFRSSDTKSS
jgi:hypothetical protein